MISYLSGNILTKSEKFIILNVGGTGYKVFLSKDMLLKLKGDKVEFFCYTNTKKDPWEIYGFLSAEGLELFEFLIGLSGIGPKAALEVSDIGSLDRIKRGVENNDPELMKDLFALGQKKAQAIIFEITRKIKTRSKKKMTEDDEEAVRALIKLGFGKGEAKEALLLLPSSVSGMENKIKEVLKLLSRSE